jgi:hypothetical protein
MPEAFGRFENRVETQWGDEIQRGQIEGRMEGQLRGGRSRALPKSVGGCGYPCPNLRVIGSTAPQRWQQMLKQGMSQDSAPTDSRSNAHRLGAHDRRNSVRRPNTMAGDRVGHAPATVAPSPPTWALTTGIEWHGQWRCSPNIVRGERDEDCPGIDCIVASRPCVREFIVGRAWPAWQRACCAAGSRHHGNGEKPCSDGNPSIGIRM